MGAGGGVGEEAGKYCHCVWVETKLGFFHTD